MKTQKGITLIALIITIIVMLILVGVSVSVALNTGLFKTAQGAAKNTETEKVKEVEISEGKITIDGKPYNSLEDYTKGKVTIPENLKVGDYVMYTPDEGYYQVDAEITGNSMNQGFWTETDAPEYDMYYGLDYRVWSIDESKGTVQLVSTGHTDGSTPLVFKDDIKQYNHGVDVLNDLCKALYSNSKIGAVARNINIEDIINVTDYNPTFSSYTIQPGTIASGTQIPNLVLKREIGDSEGVRKADGTADFETYTGYSTSLSNEINVKSTSYSYNASQNELINIGENYWLSTRNAWWYEEPSFGWEFSNFFVIVNESGSISTTGVEANLTLWTRPIIELPASVYFTESATESPQDGYNCWDIK